MTIGEDVTDAKRNLTDALIYASDAGSHGVSIVFFGSVICGTRARKNYSKSFMAFGSINFPELARIQDGRVIRYVAEAPVEGVKAQPITLQTDVTQAAGFFKVIRAK
mgnify:CR=1 FL=1